MPYIQNSFEIKNIKRLNKSCFDFIIFCPEIVELARPGQFLHIKCDGKTLRRPISICEINKISKTIRIVFDIKGEGTEWLSKRIKGEKLDILGPLGNGFNIDNPDLHALFVGGGIGVPPLLETAKAFNGNADAILGFKCADNSILLEDFKKECKSVMITSDDGSICHKGYTTDVLIERLKQVEYDIVYSCGPSVMLKKVCEICNNAEIPCYVSLEEHMGCGVGACLVCACKIMDNNKETYKHVCKDGPVFSSREVIW